jgi:hypothetical protein
MTADEHSVLEMLAGSTDGALGGAREKQSFSEWARVRGRIAFQALEGPSLERV